MKHPPLQDAILAHLLASGPVSSRDLAARFLLIRQSDETTCHRLIAPLLAAIPGVSHRPGVGWSFKPRAGAPPPSPPTALPAPQGTVPAWGDFVTLASDGAGPGGSGAVRTVSLLPVVSGEECQEEHFPSWGIDAEGTGPDESSGFPEDRAARRQPRQTATFTAADLEALLEAIGDLPILCHRAGREVEPLRRACVAAGLSFHPVVISTARLGHLLLGLKTNHTAIDLAQALGVEVRGPDDCRGRVRIVAASYLKMVPDLEERGIDSLATLLEFQELPPEPVDLSRYAFSVEDLRALPAAPGVYRFLDRQGEMIYVGKAKNLRSRIASYFTPSARGTEKGRALLDQVHAFLVEPVASDLEAALLEAALLAERRPRLNRQFEVHERPAPFGPRLNLIVVLPDTRPAESTAPSCTVHLLRAGRYLGRVRGLLPPFAGPAESSSDAWSRCLSSLGAYFSGAGRAGAGGENLAGAPLFGTDVDWHLVSSYLRAHRDEVNILDLDECPSPDAAARRLLVLVEAACTGSARVVAR